MSTPSLRSILQQRLVVLDGAMGTALQARALTAADFGGAELEGCNEVLVLERPDVISDIHAGYLAAGADIVETNTFNGTPTDLDNYGIGSRAAEINETAARLARAAADAASTPARPRFVAGSMGPTTRAMSLMHGVVFADFVADFAVQAAALIRGGVDYLLLETCQDSRNIKAAFLGIARACEEAGRDVPVAVSGTIEAMGTMLAGQSVDALLASLAHRDLLYIGLNCATGPEFMTDHIRSLAAASPFPVACVPNAGLPDEDGNYLESPDMIAHVLERFVDADWLNLVGGCCGTTPAHIEALDRLVAGRAPRVAAPPARSTLSGIDFLEVNDDVRPVIVGERTNSIGSRKFKRLINEGNVEDASEIARAQVRGGAQIIDVCVANPDRDEYPDMEEFLDAVTRKIRVPLMIDSTDAEVIEMALSYCQGKAIINSINLEDGEERFEAVVPLARQFGAALIVGCIDEDPVQGMAITVERKVEVARRSYELLTEKYGVAAEDIYWDPLVFPCATGDEQYVGSAAQTIDGVRAVKEAFPGTRTVLGISNVSFGLPPAGREVLNSVFLYHCVQAGLDLAIVNAEKLERYASIPDEEKELADNLLFDRGDDPVAAFAAHFRGRKAVAQVDKSTLPLDQRLAAYIVDGTRDGLVADLDEALQTQRPLAIINGPLMTGMDEVGRLFNDNKLIVAEVLQSAESMRAAVAHLEQFMDKADSANRGTMVLATVKGDVHDIGKNLVDIIFTNNGFTVINLGIKVPPERLIDAVREHQPDLVGLSGLLVKSAHQMTVTAEDFTQAGVTVPLLLGGAALSERFVINRVGPVYGGTVHYASDAMSGLELAKQIVSGEAPVVQAAATAQAPEKAAAAREAPAAVRSVDVPAVTSPPSPPDLGRHILRNTPLPQIWQYVNPMMLYGRHLGLKGSAVRKLPAGPGDAAARRALADDNAQALKVYDAVQAVMAEFADGSLFSPSAVYRFFAAESDGNTLTLHDAEGPCSFEFPRQLRPQQGCAPLCIADYTNPTGAAPDHVALFVTTAGRPQRPTPNCCTRSCAGCGDLLIRRR
jgi:5-methyltetrahydrofolate--homocysteine methyltransferase